MDGDYLIPIMGDTHLILSGSAMDYLIKKEDSEEEQTPEAELTISG